MHLVALTGNLMLLRLVRLVQLVQLVLLVLLVLLLYGSATRKLPYFSILLSLGLVKWKIASIALGPTRQAVVFGMTEGKRQALSAYMQVSFRKNIFKENSLDWQKTTNPQSVSCFSLLFTSVSESLGNCPLNQVRIKCSKRCVMHAEAII